MYYSEMDILASIVRVSQKTLNCTVTILYSDQKKAPMLLIILFVSAIPVTMLCIEENLNFLTEDQKQNILLKLELSNLILKNQIGIS